MCKEQLSKETFVQKTVVQGYLCPKGQIYMQGKVSKRLMSERAFTSDELAQIIFLVSILFYNMH